MSTSYAVSACDCGFLTATAERAPKSPRPGGLMVTHAR